MTPGTNRPTYVLHLRADQGIDAIRALRGLLKLALRRFQLRAVSVHEESERPSIRRGRVRSGISAVGVTAMGLGKRKGQEFLPRLKFDARSGTLYCEDRVNVKGVWETQQRNVTEGFSAIFDLAQIKIGWMNFPRGQAPDLVLYTIGADIGDAPTKDHKQGFKLLLKMPPKLGGDVREFLSTANATWNALDHLHTFFTEQAAKHPGKLPVVKLTDVIEDVKPSGASFTPVFEIFDWVERPIDLPKEPPTANGGQRKPAKAARDKGRNDMDIPF